MSELEQAIALWQITRHPDLPHVIRALATQLRGHEVQPVRTTPSFRGTGVTAEVQQAWLERARTCPPEELDELLATLTQGYVRHAEPRLQVLLARGPDPRVAEAAMLWCREHTYVGQPLSSDWWVGIGQVLAGWLPHDFDFAAFAEEVQHGGYGASNNSIRVGRMIGRLKSVAPQPTPLTPPQQERLAGWLQDHPLPRSRSAADDAATVEALLTAIHDDPDDDGPRWVLADILSQREDPRGRFLQLQMQRADHARSGAVPSAALPQYGSTEEHALLKANEARWFGSWFTTVFGAEIERGFPRMAWMYGKQKHLGKVVGEPGLSTVRELEAREGDRASQRAWLGLLRSEQARNLKVLRGVPTRVLMEVPSFSATLDTIELPYGGIDDLPAFAAAVADVRRLRLPRSQEPIPLAPFTNAVLVVEGTRPNPEEYLPAALESVAPAVRQLVVVSPFDQGQLPFEVDAAGARLPVLRPVHPEPSLTAPLGLLAMAGAQHITDCHDAARYCVRSDATAITSLLHELPPAPLHVRRIGREDMADALGSLPAVPELSMESLQGIELEALQDLPQIAQVRMHVYNNELLLQRDATGRFAVAHVLDASGYESTLHKVLDLLWTTLSEVRYWARRTTEPSLLARFADTPGPRLVATDDYPHWPPRRS